MELQIKRCFSSLALSTVCLGSSGQGTLLLSGLSESSTECSPQNFLPLPKNENCISFDRRLFTFQLSYLRIFTYGHFAKSLLPLHPILTVRILSDSCFFRYKFHLLSNMFTFLIHFNVEHRTHVRRRVRKVRK